MRPGRNEDQGGGRGVPCQRPTGRGAVPTPQSESRTSQYKETIPGIMLKMQSFLDFIKTKKHRKCRVSVESRESGTGGLSWPLARIPMRKRRMVHKPPGPQPAVAGTGLTEGLRQHPRQAGDTDTLQMGTAQLVNDS